MSSFTESWGRHVSNNDVFKFNWTCCYCLFLTTTNDRCVDSGVKTDSGVSKLSVLSVRNVVWCIASLSFFARARTHTHAHTHTHKWCFCWGMSILFILPTNQPANTHARTHARTRAHTHTQLLFLMMFLLKYVNTFYFAYQPQQCFCIMSWYRKFVTCQQCKWWVMKMSVVLHIFLTRMLRYCFL